MCGRFTLRTPLKDVLKLFDLDADLSFDLPARFNIAPSQRIAAVRLDESGRRQLTLMQWGLIPSWADDPAIGNRMINARSESAATKPAFREAFRRRRCLIPSDGFYEWKKEGRHKQPFLIQVDDGRLFAFAGLWESWRHHDLAIESCTILTTSANPLLTPLHDRMPVILGPSDYQCWLDPQQDRESLEALMTTFDPGRMSLTPVAAVVNSPRNEGSQCLQPPAARPKQGSLFD